MGKNVPARFGVASLILAGICATAGWYATGYLQDLMVALFGTLCGLSIGLFVVNIYLDRKSKKIAAAPLAMLIETAVNRLHNDYFLGIAHAKFGSTKFGEMISSYISAGRNPSAFSPEEKAALTEMLEDHKDQIKLSVHDIDQRFSTLISVLGWNFDAKTVGAAIEAKRNASELIAAFEGDDPDRGDRLIEHWFDIDASANATRTFLANVLEVDPKLL